MALGQRFAEMGPADGQCRAKMLVFWCGWKMRDRSINVGILVWVGDEGLELQCCYSVVGGG